MRPERFLPAGYGSEETGYGHARLKEYELSASRQRPQSR